MNFDIMAIAANALWGAVMAGGLAVFFTVPRGALWIAFICGALGRGVRSGALQADQGLIRATLLAALIVALGALVLAPGRQLSPVIAMSALIPLGAAGDAFDVIWAALRIPGTTDAAALATLSADVMTNAISVAAVTMAIAVGFLLPWLLVRMLRNADA